MKTLSLAVLSLACLGGAALADDVTVVPSDPQSGVVVHHDAPADATDKTVVIHKDEGCSTKSVSKSDDMGNSVTHTKTDC